MTTDPGAWITVPVMTSAPGPIVRLVGGVLSVSGPGITLQGPQTGLLNGTVSFTGIVAEARTGETVTIERQGTLGGHWVPTASAPVGQGGFFRARWRVSQSGSLRVRAVLEAPYTTDWRARGAGLLAAPTVSGSALLPATATLTLTVYRSAIATLYGPGLYGRRTACGERLTRTILGVANRDLKCGAKVAIYFAGRELVVPVIDRGPYANGASWDLTMATAKAIGIIGTTTVGALSPPPAG
jgi:hypothetical protein